MKAGDRVILKSRPVTGRGTLGRCLRGTLQPGFVRSPDKYLLQFEDGARARWVTLDEVMPEKVNARAD